MDKISFSIENKSSREIDFNNMKFENSRILAKNLECESVYEERKIVDKTDSNEVNSTKINNKLSVNPNRNSILQNNNKSNNQHSMLTNFPYLVSEDIDNSNNILPISHICNLDSEIFLNDSSALTLMKLNNNISVLAFNDDFFYLEQ